MAHRLVFGLVIVILKCTKSQIIPESMDYQNFPLPTNIRPNEISSQLRQSAFTFGSCKVLFNPVCPDDFVTFFLYTKAHPEKPEAIKISPEPGASNLNETLFNPEKPTKFIIHGYNSDMNLSALVEIRKEYLKTNDFNVFTVDWSPLNQGPCYLGALWNTRHVGACSALLIQRIREAGAVDIHVIGFSLGAHISGFLANNLRPYKLPRITGLDPALPGFITPNLDDKLDRTDAEFVDVYHTNAFIQGKVEESGHVDFYLNGGVIQPGCWAENRFFACNHHRAPLYFAESINSDKGFWGWPCPSYFQYLLGNCHIRDPQIVMGEWIRAHSRGVYLGITESVAPYAVGKYNGPNIEIYLKSQLMRTNLLQMYREQILQFYDTNDLVDEISNEDLKQTDLYNHDLDVIDFI